MRLALVVLLPLLTLVSARAQTVVYEGETTKLNVESIASDCYTWEIYNDPTVDFATVPGNCPVTSATFEGGNTGASVMIKWLKPGIYFYKITARDAALCAMNMKVGMIKVFPEETEAVITGVTIAGACQKVKLDASKSIGDILKYEWSLVDPGGELTQTTGINTEFLLSSTFTGSLPANFNVKLLVTDRNGKINSKIVTIKVDRQPKAKVYSSGIYEKDKTLIVNGTLSEGTGLKYNWYTAEGTIIGPNNQMTAKLSGTGLYTLKISDIYNCPNEYSFPLKFEQIIARRDYARISWAGDTTLNVLGNDNLPEDFTIRPLAITRLPLLGEAKPNTDGTITYTPHERGTGQDQFVYEVCDAMNNCSQAVVTIDIYDSPLTIPEGFSPNGDGKNDLLKFEGLPAYGKSQLSVFTRSGLIVYRSEDYKNDWDGTNQESSTSNPQLVTTGTYYFILKLGGTNRIIKDFVYIGY